MMADDFRRMLAGFFAEQEAVLIRNVTAAVAGLLDYHQQHQTALACQLLQEVRRLQAKQPEPDQDGDADLSADTYDLDSDR